MKKALLLLCLGTVALAQEPAQRPPQTAPAARPQIARPSGTTNLAARAQAPSYSDLYCAGFISGQSLPSGNFVAGGWESPDQTRFGENNYIYIAGDNLQEGSRYTIVRELRDPNRSEAFPGQRRSVAALGNAYAELGRVRIIGHGNKMNIGLVEFSCDTIVPGDTAVPFAERPQITYRTAPFDRFAAPSGKLGGRIILAKDFDFYAATGRTVYLNVGADQGVKPGDYFRVVRAYTASYRDPLDSLSKRANIAEDTQKHPPSATGYGMGAKVDVGGFPRKSIGEMIVLNSTPKSATAMVTFALEEIRVGDNVEQEEPPPPPPPPPTPQPPTISCAAQPDTIKAGESSTITCQAASPDNRPVSITFGTDRGRIVPGDSSARLDTGGAAAGPITVTATATDDRGLNAMATTAVNVTEAAPPPPPATAEKAGDVAFGRGSSRVDNRAKAMLDQIALRMQREPDSRVVVIGSGAVSTPAGQRLATARAENLKAYLVRDKGIDANRIETRVAEGGDTAEVWIVPAGAQMPQ